MQISDNLATAKFAALVVVLMVVIAGAIDGFSDMTDLVCSSGRCERVWTNCRYVRLLDYNPGRVIFCELGKTRWPEDSE